MSKLFIGTDRPETIDVWLHRVLSVDYANFINSVDDISKKINNSIVATLLKSYKPENPTHIHDAQYFYHGRALRLGNNEKALNDFLNTVSIIDIYDSIEGLK